MILLFVFTVFFCQTVVVKLLFKSISKSGFSQFVLFFVVVALVVIFLLVCICLSIMCVFFLVISVSSWSLDVFVVAVFFWPCGCFLHLRIVVFATEVITEVSFWSFHVPLLSLCLSSWSLWMSLGLFCGLFCCFCVFLYSVYSCSFCVSLKSADIMMDLIFYI